MKKKIMLTLLAAMLLVLLCGTAMAVECYRCHEGKLEVDSSDMYGCNFKCSAGCMTGYRVHTHSAGPCEICDKTIPCDRNTISNGDGTHTTKCTKSGCPNPKPEVGTCSGGDAATCIKKSVCSACNGEYGSFSNNHSFTTYVVTTPATCTAAGVETATCDNGCGETDEQAIPTDGTHDYKAVKKVDPSCTKRGYTKYECKDCKDSYKDNYKAKLMHWFDVWTSNGDGTHSAPCKREDCEHVGKTACAAFEVTVNGEILNICPVCDANFALIEGAAIAEVDKNACPGGEAVVRGKAAPFDGAIYAFTAAWEYSGKPEELQGRVEVSLPVSVEGSFKLMRVEVILATDTAQRAENWVEVAYELEEGVMRFETEANALYLLVAAE